MALRGQGQLLVEVSGRPLTARPGAEPPFVLPGHALEPLSAAPSGRPAPGAASPADHRLLARPGAARTDASPWETAHAAADASGYAHYVEPDILHEAISPPPGRLDGGLDEDWPPAAKDGPSPGWHLEAGFTGFADVRAIADGAGVRIAQL